MRSLHGTVVTFLLGTFYCIWTITIDMLGYYLYNYAAYYLLLYYYYYYIIICIVCIRSHKNFVKKFNATGAFLSNRRSKISTQAWWKPQIMKYASYLCYVS